jgi:hypothetical protein
MRLWLGLGLGLSLGVASGCTQGNPAFGDAADETQSVGAETDGTTSAGVGEGRTDADDPSGGDGTSTTATGGADETGTTAAPGACDVQAPERFSVEVRNANGTPVPLECGDAMSWTGTLVGTAPNELRVNACPETCPCPEASAAFKFEFVDLTIPDTHFDISDHDLCVEIDLAQGPAAAGCEVDWISVVASRATGDDEGRAVLAASNIAATITQPAIDLGSVLQECDEAACPDHQSGRYALQFVEEDLPQFSPSDPPVDVQIEVASVYGHYRVKALTAMVDGDCRPHVGWIAFGGETE